MKRLNSNQFGKVWVYQRIPRGSWYFSYTNNGEKIEKSLKTNHLGKASEIARKISEGLIDVTAPVIDIPDTIEEGITQYLEHLESEGRSSGTLIRYRPVFKRFNTFCNTKRIKKFNQFNQRVLELYRKERQHTASDGTRYLESKCIVAFGRYLSRNGIIAKVPFNLDGIKKPKTTPLEWFSKGEVEAILKKAKKQDKKIFEVLAFTGMRISEAKRLTWDDVDFEAGFIHVISTNTNPTKSGLSRKIPMHYRVRKVLSSIENQEDFVFNAGKSKKHPDKNGPIHGRKVLARLKKLLDELELQGCLHSFRKFFCSYMANSGVPPTTLIKWSGHQDLKVMMDHYYKLTDDESVNIMDRFDPSNSTNKKVKNPERHSRDKHRDKLAISALSVS
ncbi:MAG: hypothetical protein COA79_22345 [Planctomycetota bacterium]|nr:MAG: hypothetical protein COA79_22345 [Planctomycetota bacterium]